MRWGGKLGGSGRPSTNNNLSPQTATKSQNTIPENEQEQFLPKIEDSGKHASLLDHPDLFTLTYMKQMSPRSIEALRQCGIMQRELLQRKKEFFLDKMPPEHPARNEVAQLRMEHHSARRRQLIKDARRKRALLVEQKWIPPLRSIQHLPPRAKGNSGTSSKRSLTAPMSSGEEASMLAEQEANEADRLVRLQERQLKSMERLITYEIKQMKARKDQIKQVSERDKHADAHKIRELKKQATLRKKKYIQEQRKKDEQENAAKSSKQKAQEEFRLQLNRMKRERRKALLDKKRTKKDIERKEQSRAEWEERIRMTQMSNMEEIDRKIYERKVREEFRERKLKQRKLKEQKELAEAQARKYMRAQKAIENNERKLLQRKIDIRRKQQEDEERLTKFLSEKRDREKIMRRKQKMLEEKRKNAKDQAEKEYEAKIQKILSKEEKMAKRAQEKAEIERKDKAIRDELRRLREKEKWESINRTKRRNEYQKTQVMGKIKSQDEKMTQMKHRKNEIIMQRRMASIDAHMKKQEILDSFNALQNSDKMTSVDNAAMEMVKLAEKYIGNTKSLKKRILDETGIVVQ